MPRAFALALLGAAVVIGAGLRFHQLTLASMNGDEGASWAAAVAHNVHKVVKAQERLDPGKLAVYDVVLHGWIRVFGDSLFSMRALSAGLGTISIVLLFAAVREACLCLADEPNEEFADVAGAFAALIFATNMRMVLESQLIRMYPLMMAAELLQIVFFVRAQRKGGFSNYAGLAIFTALMVAANFSAIFLLAAQALWLAILLAGKWIGGRAGNLAIFRPGFAVIAGVAVLIPTLPSVSAASTRALRYGFYNWIHRQPITWPYTVLSDAVMSNYLFWIFIALAAFGVWRQWRAARWTSAFMVLWTAGPLLVAVAVTYLIHSIEVARYVLIAFAGLFALAAVGAACVPTIAARLALAVLVAVLAIGPTIYATGHPHQADWHPAVAAAVRHTAPGERIAVIPAYEVNAVRYYLPPARRDAAVGLDFGCGSARVLLFTEWWWLPADQIKRAHSCFPRLLKSVPLAEVRSR